MQPKPNKELGFMRIFLAIELGFVLRGPKPRTELLLLRTGRYGPTHKTLSIPNEECLHPTNITPALR